MQGRTRTICFVVGARPNFMKAAPVYRAVRELESAIDLRLIHTGQHYDAEMSTVFVQELDLPHPDIMLNIGSGSHAEQTARALVGIERVLVEDRPDLVIVAGDVNSTLAAALAAAKLQIPVAHIESGLRSFDNSMPEEINRRLTYQLSSILLVHSRDALDNLMRENIPTEIVHFVGNTMIDSLLEHVARARGLAPWRDLGVEPRRYGLVTLHRPALVDDIALLGPTVEAIRELAKTYQIVFPVHPRTRARLLADGRHMRSLEDPRIVVCKPLGYLAFLGLEAEAAFVLTDRGGVQEETSALGIPCFTLRAHTERPITIELGTNTLLGVRPERICEIPELVAQPRDVQPIPLWDGNAGVRTARVLRDFLISR